MNVTQCKRNFSSLKKTILQLQLSLEFSQINEILSTYNEALLFLTEYSFLFETFFKETPSLKNTHTNFKSPFSTQDPARDGSNWFGYAGQNPLTNVDYNGLEVFSINPNYSMSDYPNVSIPNDPNNTTIAQGGCAITLDANVCYTLGNTNITPETIVNETNNFNENGGLIWSNPLPENIITTHNDSNLTVQQFNDLNNSLDSYFVGIKVQYTGTLENPSNSPHWVGANSVYTDSNGNDYYVISPTSSNDNVMGTMQNGTINNRGGLGWQNIDGVGTVVPVDRVTESIVFQITNNGDLDR